MLLEDVTPPKLLSLLNYIVSVIQVISHFYAAVIKAVCILSFWNNGEDGGRSWRQKEMHAGAYPRLLFIQTKIPA
jgi:hypothetical protein